jgi:hypothetical protein
MEGVRERCCGAAYDAVHHVLPITDPICVDNGNPELREAERARFDRLLKKAVDAEFRRLQSIFEREVEQKVAERVADRQNEINKQEKELEE